MKYLSLLTCLLITLQVSASSKGQWQCMAFDARERNFTATAKTIEKAMEDATTHCKQGSNQPKTCKSAQSFCEQGAFAGDDDRCLVTDDDGHAWDTNGDNSCKTALDMCNQFINLEGGAHGQCYVKHGGGGN